MKVLKELEDAVYNIAHEEADDIAECFIRFGQKHETCPMCSYKKFCDKIAKRYRKLEKDFKAGK